MLVNVMLKATRKTSETGDVPLGLGGGLIGKSGAETRKAVDARLKLDDNLLHFATNDCLTISYNSEVGKHRNWSITLTGTLL